MFIAKDRVPSQGLTKFFEGHADFVIEVLSPDDRGGKLHEKVRAYLASGTRLVWVVDPENETVSAYLPTGEAHIYSGDDIVACDNILPGFSMRPSKLFAN